MPIRERCRNIYTEDNHPLNNRTAFRMTYDPGLEARLDEVSCQWYGYAKKKMFGGLGYLKSGNMSFGIWKDWLIVRCGPERHTEYLQRPHTKVFDITGKAMSGWLMISQTGYEDDSALQDWLSIADKFAGSLPPK